jgi:hypothetical protein
MAGILDPKTRIMDFILTELGREQAAHGELNIKYATFSDRAAFYSSGSQKGIADDASSRLYFEAASSPHDSIVIESDFEGKIKPFKADDFIVEGGNVISASVPSGETHVLQNSEIINVAPKILGSITSSFKNIQFIKTTDMFLEGRDFVANPKSLFFEFNDDPVRPVTTNAKNTLNIENIPSLFQDKKLSHLPNFRFMPPRNSSSPENLDGNSLGTYLKFRKDHPWHQDPEKAHLIAKTIGSEKREIFFSETTPDNNLLVQPFEFTRSGVTKLSVIDGGTYMSHETRERRHIFYIGKLMADSKSTTTYVHIFTLVFKETNI